MPQPQTALFLCVAETRRYQSMRGSLSELGGLLIATVIKHTVRLFIQLFMIV